MGPLQGIKIVELKGIGPGPYATMLLADMGADVITVERSRKPSGISFPAQVDINCRGKRSIALNLKSPQGLEILLDLIEQADMLVEGFRPGVAEKLGFGPEVCHARNPKLVYGRMTGWGQTGPLAKVAGHDLNYIALTGSLAAIGERERPIPPLNLVGDYAGGSLFLVMGMLAALHAAQKSGKGDVVDAAITDGTASLMSIVHTFNNLGIWNTQRAANGLDGGSHYYRCYATADGKHVAIGSIEPQFYALLLEMTGMDPIAFADQLDPAGWEAKAAILAEVFKTKTRDEWCALMEGTEVCFAPVLDFTEAPQHPHNKARGTYIEVGGIVQPAPAPRFTHHPLETPHPPKPEGADTDAILADLGLSAEQIAGLYAAKVIPE